MIPSQQRQRELIAINILRMLKGFLQAEEKHGWMQTMAWEIGLCSQTHSLVQENYQKAAGEPGPACCLCVEFAGPEPHLFICIVSVAAFVLELQS